MPKLVLVVDDVEMMTELAGEVLRKAGYAVRALNNPALVMTTLRTERPDLLVLDIQMPGLSGIDLLREIRADEGLVDLPVLVMTASGQMQRIVASFGEGADDYLFKPYEPADLVARAAKLIGPA